MAFTSWFGGQDDLKNIVQNSTGIEGQITVSSTTSGGQEYTFNGPSGSYNIVATALDSIMWNPYITSGYYGGVAQLPIFDDPTKKLTKDNLDEQIKKNWDKINQLIA
jgi:hypothetical protein